jgi:hypothetical protein
MNFMQVWELLSYIVTVVGLPLAIFVFIYEQRKARENEEEQINQLLSDGYIDFLKLTIDNPDLKLQSSTATPNLSEDQRERMLGILGILVSLFERAYLVTYDKTCHHEKCAAGARGKTSCGSGACARIFAKTWRPCCLARIRILPPISNGSHRKKLQRVDRLWQLIDQFHLETDVRCLEPKPYIEPVRVRPHTVGHQLHEANARRPTLLYGMANHGGAYAASAHVRLRLDRFDDEIGGTTGGHGRQKGRLEGPNDLAAEFGDVERLAWICRNALEGRLVGGQGSRVGRVAVAAEVIRGKERHQSWNVLAPGDADVETRNFVCHPSGFS